MQKISISINIQEIYRYKIKDYNSALLCHPSHLSSKCYTIFLQKEKTIRRGGGYIIPEAQDIRDRKQKETRMFERRGEQERDQ